MELKIRLKKETHFDIPSTKKNQRTEVHESIEKHRMHEETNETTLYTPHTARTTKPNTELSVPSITIAIRSSLFQHHTAIIGIDILAPGT